jgi:hypothetical protein
MFQSLLSIVNQINVERVTLFKAKDNTPIAANTDAPKPFQVAFQRMKAPTREQSYISRTGRFIDR